MPSNSLLLITLGAFAFLATALIGFLVGRSRPRQADLARIAELEGALEQTRTELESSAGEIESAHAEAAATRAGSMRTSIAAPPFSGASPRTTARSSTTGPKAQAASASPNPRLKP